MLYGILKDYSTRELEQYVSFIDTRVIDLEEDLEINDPHKSELEIKHIKAEIELGALRKDKTVSILMKRDDYLPF